MSLSGSDAGADLARDSASPVGVRVDLFPGLVTDLHDALRRNHGVLHHRVLPVHGVRVEIFAQMPMLQGIVVELRTWEGDGDEEGHVRRTSTDQALGQFNALRHFRLGFVWKADHHVHGRGDSGRDCGLHELDDIELVMAEFAGGVLVENALAPGFDREHDLVEASRDHCLEVLVVRMEASAFARHTEVHQVNAVHIADLEAEASQPGEDLHDSGLFGQ